ncbi:SdiA-regulated protein [Mariniflexile fucanivorans]|uniref:SdiA-regulated protein n=1 Tax=Mariniflexile fucanivorans TaxID=264023 RepID=A0A4V2QD18_9FLAO|nr:SdiA-regulated domain-containing protein [Mariniflexile fucanivorans]TCL62607.1 SdiA-regulated protein [Mariniflexile fucanivorans]
MIKKNLCIAILSVSLSCITNSQTSFDLSKHYDLKKPSEYFEMPYELREISGIDTINAHQLITHNDEKGEIFIYDLNNESIKKTISFGKKGDYENITIVGKTAFVLRSDGTIYEVKNYLENPITTIHKTFLSKKDNVESLCYDQENNQLLLATKGNKVKKIYAFSLENNELISKPIFEINPKIIKKHYHTKNDFSPSAIAIQPITKNYIILSSIGKMLVEFDNEGQLIHVFNINYAYFRQPEGLCFSKNGDMYISNESKNSKANILKFDYLP